MRKPIIIILVLVMLITPSSSQVNDNPSISTDTKTILEFSGNMTFVYGSTGNVMTFTAIESILPWDYFVFDNSSMIIGSTGWINNTQNFINLDILNVGVHLIRVEVWSAEGDTNLIAYVSVLADTQEPLVESLPVITMIQGTTGNLFHFNVSDNAATRYRYDTGGGFSLWSDNDTQTAYNFSLDYLTANFYNLSLQVSDITGNTVTTYTDVAVYVPGAEGFTNVPTTTTLTYGDVVVEAWRIYVPNADRVRFNVDGIGWQDYGAAVNGLGYPIDFTDTSIQGDFSPGVHSVEMQVNDTSGQVFSHTHTIIVNSATISLFVITPLSDVYRLDNEEYSLTWSAISLSPNQYRFWVNGSTTDWVSWQSNVPFLYEGNLVGVQNITLELTGTGGTYWDTVIVNPVTLDINVLTSVSYAYGSVGNSISWSASESLEMGVSNNFTFTLESSIQTGTWDHEDLKIFGIDGLSLGQHIATLNVTYLGVFLIREVTVTVYDLVVPILTSPADVSYTFGTVDHQISWIITELFPLTYRFDLDGDLTAWTPFFSGENVTFSIDGLTVGVHSLTLQVLDSSGNLATDTVIISVVSGNPPATETVTDTLLNTVTETFTQDNTITITDTRSASSSTTDESSSPILGLLFLVLVPLVRSRKSYRSV